MQISNREKKIIEGLLKNPRSFLTIHQIAQNLGVSSRTVHRELRFVEETLERYGLALERLTNKGLRISGDSAAIYTLTEQLGSTQVLDLSVEERKVVILYTLIKAKEPVKLYSLASEMGISINKLNKELTELETDLARYHLTLQKKRGEGIQLIGDEMNRRQLLADLMLEKLNSTSVYSVIEDHFVYQTLNDQKLLDLVDMDQIFNVERLLMDELAELPYVLMETAYLTLTIHIVLAIERIRNGEQVSINDDLIRSLQVTPEFKVAQNLAQTLAEAYGVPFDLEEVIFITMHLRGAKRRADESETLDVRDETEALIHEVERLTHADFKQNETLREGILLHLVPALNRISGGIETYNPLTDMIKQDYSSLFNAVSQALMKVFPNHHFPDSETAFIVLHFGGALKAARQLSVLVVCTSGIGTSRILSNQIEQTFPKVHVSRQASVSELKQIELDQFDYIISTVGLDIEQSYTVVNPLLPDSDQHVLAQIFSMPMSESRPSPVQTIRTDVYNEVVSYVTEGSAVIAQLHTVKAVHEDAETWICNYLFEQQVIDDKAAVLDLLQLSPGYAVTGSPVAIPHLVHPLIKRSHVALVTIEPVTMKNMDGEWQEVHYMALMFLPPDTAIRPLVSDLSVLIMEHLESPDKLFESEQFVVNHMKQALLQGISNQIY